MTNKKRTPPYIVDEKKYRRYDERNHPLGKMNEDPGYRHYRSEYYDFMDERINEKKPGYSKIDYILEIAAWTLYEEYKPLPKEKKVSSPRYKVEDREKITAIIKKAASFFGANLVGICKFNEKWVYSHDQKGTPIEIPDKYTHVIVMAVAMDPVTLGSSPSATAGAATALGYSKCAFLVKHLSAFIRRLGYSTIDMINDTALSIPLAAEAGLGQLGRNGLLITKEYGSGVRICKIFTDLPLKIDQPVDFGVTEYCKQCKKCAEECEADAISSDEKPSFKTACDASNPGVKKWYVDGEKCFDYWYENGMDCATCITVCPFSKLKPKIPKDFWKIDI